MKIIEPTPLETCDVIILTNTSDDDVFTMTQNAIKSLKNSEKADCFRVILVESNHSSKYVYQGVTLMINTSGEFNYNKALNDAFVYLNSDYVYVSNNDVLFTEGWYSTLRNYMRTFDLDSASPRCPTEQYGLKPEAQQEILNFPADCVVVGYRTVVNFCGWGWCMSQELLRQMLPLDESLTFWFQDDDLVRTLEKMNKKHGLVTSSHVIHFGQSSYRLIDPSKLHGYTIGLQDTFVNKWIKNGQK